MQHTKIMRIFHRAYPNLNGKVYFLLTRSYIRLINRIFYSPVDLTLSWDARKRPKKISFLLPEVRWCNTVIPPGEKSPSFGPSLLLSTCFFQQTPPGQENRSAPPHTASLKPTSLRHQQSHVTANICGGDAPNLFTQTCTNMSTSVF